MRSLMRRVWSSKSTLVARQRPLLHRGFVGHGYHAAASGRRPRIKSYHINEAVNLQRRQFVLPSPILSVLLPPTIFIGLLVVLWSYKCLMMIVFQNKIIYMPSIPPFSRGEKIESYASQCQSIVWREERIRSIDGTPLAMCIGSNIVTNAKRPHTYILYFQGNASSLPPRLPLLSRVLKELEKSTPCTVVGLSYRGFWKSSGSASENGIKQDASAALAWLMTLRDLESPDSRIIVWGQSLGAGVAADVAAKNSQHLDAMILETPFASMKEMLISLYPQRWLPYRYLWPFLRSSWDNLSALSLLSFERLIPILVLVAERDEVVPSEQSVTVLELAQNLKFPVSIVNVPGALHHEALLKREGREAVAEFIEGSLPDMKVLDGVSQCRVNSPTSLGDSCNSPQHSPSEERRAPDHHSKRASLWTN